MNNENWEKIREYYKEAKHCLWCPKHHSDGWMRDEDRGMYYLWQAYYLADSEYEKDDLTYARILMMMNHELSTASFYERRRKYVIPAKEAYERAVLSDGPIPSFEELQEMDSIYQQLEYRYQREKDTEKEIEEAYSRIEGLSDIPEFGFHDSKPYYFEHDNKNAVLKLDDDGIKIKLVFEDVIDLEVNGDPTTNWIEEFYCYPCLHNKETLQFDVGYYRILCKKIAAVREN